MDLFYVANENQQLADALHTENQLVLRVLLNFYVAGRLPCHQHHMLHSTFHHHYHVCGSNSSVHASNYGHLSSLA